MQQQLSIQCDSDDSIANYVCITCKKICCKKCIEQHSNNNCEYTQLENFITFYNNKLNQTYSVKKLQDFDSNLIECRERVKYLRLKLKNLQDHLKDLLITENINERIIYRMDQEQFQENFLKEQTKENLQKMISQVICKNGQKCLGEPDDETSQANINIIEQQIQQINLVCQQFDNFFDEFDVNKQLNPDQEQLQQLNTTVGESDQSNDISEIQSQISSDIDDPLENKQNEILQNDTKYNQAIQALFHIQEKQNLMVQQEIQPEEKKIKFLITYDNQDVIAATNNEIFLIEINQNQVKCSSLPRLYGQHSKNQITALSKSVPQRKQEFIIALKSGFIQIWNSNNNQLNYQSMYQLSSDYGRMLIGLQIDTLVILGGDKQIKYFNLNLKKFTYKQSLKNINQLNETPQCMYVEDNTDFIVVGGIASFIVYRERKLVKVRGSIDQQQKIKFIGKNQKNQLFIVTINKIYVYEENKYHNYEILYIRKEIYNISYFSVFDSYILINLKEQNQNNCHCKIAEFDKNQLKITKTQNVQSTIRLCILQEQQNKKVFQIFITQNLMVTHSQIIIE